MRMKKLTMVLIVLLSLPLLTLNINVAFAWYNTPVQTKTVDCPLYASAKMGSTTQYGYIGPSTDRHPQFYSALIARALWSYNCAIEHLKIEVSGKDPLGNSLAGDRFVGVTILVSPDGSNVVQEILVVVFDVLLSKIPYGLGEAVKKTLSAIGGSSTGCDSTKAWAQWARPLFAPILDDRGLRFGYQLAVDPALEGTYTINIRYHALISQVDPFYPGGPFYVDIDLYDTVQYTYVNTPNTPSTPSGPTSGYVYTTYTYSTSTTDPNGDSVRYEFNWGDGTTTLTGWYTSGATASASHYWASTGTKYVKVRAQDSTGAWSGWSPSLAVSISGGGGGCPILSVFDGSEYVLEGLLDIHNPEGVDVVYEHTLVTTPQRVNGAYLMRLTEHPKTHSYIDQVKLYAVLEDGTIIQLPLIWACHSENGIVLPQLLFSDDWKADTLGADHNNGTSQSIDLKFAALPPNLEITDFVFRIEGNNMLVK